MTGLVFVDTNVLLYAIGSREGSKHRSASDWLGRLWRERTGRTSVQVLSEFFVNATCKLSPGLPREQAWEHVVALSAWDPQTADFLVLELGMQVQSHHGLSWWESLVVAAAHRQGCGTLLTEDLSDGLIDATGGSI